MFLVVYKTVPGQDFIRMIAFKSFYYSVGVFSAVHNYASYNSFSFLFFFLAVRRERRMRCFIESELYVF